MTPWRERRSSSSGPLLEIQKSGDPAAKVDFLARPPGRCPFQSMPALPAAAARPISV